MSHITGAICEEKSLDAEEVEAIESKEKKSGLAPESSSSVVKHYEELHLAHAVRMFHSECCEIKLLGVKEDMTLVQDKLVPPNEATESIEETRHDKAIAKCTEQKAPKPQPPICSYNDGKNTMHRGDMVSHVRERVHGLATEIQTQDQYGTQRDSIDGA